MARLAPALPTVALVLVLTTTAGCAANVDGTFAAQAAPGSVATGAPTAAPTAGPDPGTQAGSLPDPCGIVEDATAARVLGGGTPVQQPYSGSRSTFKSCSWRTDPARITTTTPYGSFNLQLVLAEGIGSRTGEQFARERFDYEKSRTSSASGPAESTPGLGEEALYRYTLYGRSHNVRLFVLVRATTLTIDLTSSRFADKQSAVDAARSIATDAVKKL